jgi:M6 family metalloprotease-like protein
MRRRAALKLLMAVAGAVALPPGTQGQDVELLSQVYGTPLPDAYYRTIAETPGAFRFTRGRAVRFQQRVRELAPGRTDPRQRGAMSIIGPREGPVVGTFRIPVLMGLFADSPLDVIPFPRELVQAAYFGEGGGTITAYYEEVSGGRVTLKGELADWTRSGLTRFEATGGKSGLSSGTAGAFIVDLLERAPAGVDWGAYDNDGPDGLPNSGDDDGFVDALAVLHPTPGAECGGSDKDNRIWSHRWALRYAARLVDGYATGTPSANGGVIRVDDYLVQPIYTCSGGSLNEIGVFTHELGHAFGLPDLYDTNANNGKHQGAGNWELMATGSWGCDGRSAEQPCHLSAWSKMVLGWADVETLPQGSDLGTLTLPPVESSGKIYRIDAGDGSGEYYLLENRQEMGFDSHLYAEGLLVWRISQPILDARWGANEVNSWAQLGVWLREADGLNELATPGCSARGNAGDPFPFVGPLKGCSGAVAEGENRVFHAGSTPASVSDPGTASGLTLLDIRRQGDDVTFRVSTRFTHYDVRTEGDGIDGNIFTVDGAAVPERGFTFRSAPFQRHVLEAAAGETLGEGVRRPFVGWGDEPQAPRSRVLQTPMEDVTLVARYEGEQYEVAVSLTGGQGSIVPGTFTTTPAAPDLWFAPGTPVTVQATPRQGFEFVRWTGALEGQGNPASLTVDAPVVAGADFTLVYKVAATTVRITAAEDPGVTLEPEHGTPPYEWSVMEGRVPQGIALNNRGQLTGVPWETGSFPLSVQVTDALGLRATGTFTLQVDEPVFPVEKLAAKFLLVGGDLTGPQLQYLDLRGNNDGIYDVGDLRAWVLAHPGLPLSASLKALVGPRQVVVPMVPTGKPEARR